MDVAAKRQIAAGLRGVSYDARIDRFTAEIWISGERRWLGSYTDADEAAEAYQQAALTRPPRTTPPSFQELYARFREEHGGTQGEGTPAKGDVLCYDGQRFVFKELAWRKSPKGAKHAFFVWESECRECGDAYTTMTAAPVSMVRGIVRTCPEHRRKSGKRGAKSDTAPRTLGEQVAAVLAPLGAVHGEMPLGHLVRELIAAMPQLPAEGAERLLRRLAGQEDAPLRIEGDRAVLL